MKKKVLAMVLAAAMAAGMLTACGSGTSSGSSSSGGSTDAAASESSEPQVSDTTELTELFSEDTTDWNYLVSRGCKQKVFN